MSEHADDRSTASAIGPDGRTIYFDDLVRDGQIVWVYGDRRSDDVRRRMLVRFDPDAPDWFVEDAPETVAEIRARLARRAPSVAGTDTA